jgi:hypothetical protein
VKNKVVFVKAHFRPLYGKPGILKAVFGSNQLGTILEIPKGFEQKGWSDCQIDGERLADDISKSINKLETDGFEVVNISNINSGSYKSDYSSSDRSSYGWGYGFSISEGVLITVNKV